MIKFEYTLSSDLLELCYNTIQDFSGNSIYGIIPEWCANKLKHCSLYMVCELNTINNQDVWSEPLAVVASNTENALEAYYSYTKKDNGSVLCEITNRCDNIKVKPIQ